MRMLPVSLNDLKGKNEGIHQRISDILRKHFFFFGNAVKLSLEV